MSSGRIYRWLQFSRNSFPVIVAGRRLHVSPQGTTHSLNPEQVLFEHCKNDRLDPAERLFLTWMKHHSQLEGTKDLIAVIGDRKSLQKNSDYLLGDVDKSVLMQSFPPMMAWHGMTTLYATRQAWKQSKAILDFLEIVEGKIEPLSSDQFSGDEDTVAIDGCKIPRNIKADYKVYKNYVNILCATDCFMDAFQVVHKMLHEKKMHMDIHLVNGFLRMIGNSSQVSDTALPQLIDGTVGLIRSLHRLNENKQQVLAATGDEHGKQKDKSNDICMLVNTLLKGMCNRGLNDKAVLTWRQLKEKGIPSNHIATEILIRSLSLKSKTVDAIKLFEEQNELFISMRGDLGAAGLPTDCRLQQSYHAITTGLRKENKLRELANFILTYGRFRDYQGTPP